MPNILIGSTEGLLNKLRKRTKKGELEEMRGAWDEPVFIQKSKGDMSRRRRQAMEYMRRKRAKENIERVRQGRIKLT